MPQWATYLIIFVCGLLFQYVFQLLDLKFNSLSNKSTLETTKIQAEINEINKNIEKDNQLEPVVGFQYQNEEENYEEEE